MNSKRVYFGMLAVVGVLFLGLFGSLYGVNGLLQRHADTLVNARLQSDVLTQQQVGLVRAKQQVSQYADLEKIAQSVVPQDKDQAEAVREISKIASDSGITQLSSVTFPASTLGVNLGSSTTTTTPTTPTSTARSNLTQLVPVPGISGVYQLQITITQSTDSRVPYTQFLDFLSRLEQNRRTAQVSSINLQPDSKDPSMVAFTLVLNEFIKP